MDGRPSKAVALVVRLFVVVSVLRRIAVLRHGRLVAVVNARVLGRVAAGVPFWRLVVALVARRSCSPFHKAAVPLP